MVPPFYIFKYSIYFSNIQVFNFENISNYFLIGISLSTGASGRRFLNASKSTLPIFYISLLPSGIEFFVFLSSISYLLPYDMYFCIYLFLATACNNLT